MKLPKNWKYEKSFFFTIETNLTLSINQVELRPSSDLVQVGSFLGHWVEKKRSWFEFFRMDNIIGNVVEGLSLEVGSVFEGRGYCLGHVVEVLFVFLEDLRVRGVRHYFNLNFEL